MQYVKVSGNTHSEALKKLRELYGSNAMIYSEKSVPNQSLFSKITGKKEFVIEAAIKEKASNQSLSAYQPMNSHKDEVSLTNTKKNSTLKKALIETLGKQHNDKDKINTFLEKLNELKAKKNDAKSSKINKESTLTDPNIELLFKDVQFIKENITQLNVIPYHNKYPFLYNIFKKNQFSDNFIKDLFTFLDHSLSIHEQKNQDSILKKSFQYLESNIKCLNSVGYKKGIAFIGPTGVGKTTTIAKLATYLKIEKKLNIAIMTIDNYRIAATEQLKTYADILDVPNIICKKPEQLEEYLTNSDVDLCLIDTAGSSPYNEKFLKTQYTFFNSIENQIDKYLVVPANTTTSNLENIVQSFNSYKYSKVIITKLDESQQYGHVIEIMNQYNKAFAFYTMGQDVPNDFQEATASYLINKILALNLKEADFQTAT